MWQLPPFCALQPPCTHLPGQTLGVIHLHLSLTDFHVSIQCLLGPPILQGSENMRGGPAFAKLSLQWRRVIVSGPKPSPAGQTY